MTGSGPSNPARSSEPKVDSSPRTGVDRWRLVLGRYAESRLPHTCGPGCGWSGAGGDGGGGGDRHTGGCPFTRREQALDFLYGREYAGRGVRPDGAGGPDTDPSLGPGGMGESAPYLVDWLGEIRDLFPEQVAEQITHHALDRYGLTDLVTDPEILATLTPDLELAATLLSLRQHLDPDVLGEVRRVITAVVEELRRKLEPELRRTLTGRMNQHRHSPMASTSSFDPRGTIRANLKHLDPETGTLVIRNPLFFERNTRRLPWEIVLCVDQSGSMAGSVIHSAVMAGILAGLPAYRLRLVVFDTSVVDLTDLVEDPVELLLSVQLGGGTNIAQAVNYCGSLIENPDRAVFVLISDFCEGGPAGDLVAATRRLVEARVTTIGLASLSEQTTPFYDRAMAGALADVGMKIAALSPSGLAGWLAEVTSS